MGLSSEALLNCFISGLRLDIQHELAFLQPHSFSQALGLAKLIVSKILNTPKPHHPCQPLPLPHSQTYALLPKPLPSAPFPIRHLAPAEIQTRRAKGLCFNYDDKFHPGRKCNTTNFFSYLTTTLRPLHVMNQIYFPPNLHICLPTYFNLR